MNTASRMESTGMPHQIQCSEETADLLQQAGKGSWLQKRENGVDAKGKGHLSTYFLFVKNEKGSFAHSTEASHSSDEEDTSECGNAKNRKGPVEIVLNQSSDDQSEPESARDNERLFVAV